MYPRTLLAFFCHEGALMARDQFVVYQDPNSLQILLSLQFSADLLSRWVVFSMCWCLLDCFRILALSGWKRLLVPMATALHNHHSYYGAFNTDTWVIQCVMWALINSHLRKCCFDISGCSLESLTVISDEQKARIFGKKQSRKQKALLCYSSIPQWMCASWTLQFWSFNLRKVVSEEVERSVTMFSDMGWLPYEKSLNEGGIWGKETEARWNEGL